MENFFAVFLGALIPALFGWYALYRENERTEYRRENFARLDSLFWSAENLVGTALKLHWWDAASADYLAGRAVSLAEQYTDRIEQYFDPAERAALRKFSSDLVSAVREIARTGGRSARARIYDRWKSAELEHLRVLRRAAYQASRAGIMSLTSRKYY